VQETGSCLVSLRFQCRSTIGKLAAAVVIPIAIVVIGNNYTARQRENDAKRMKLDRVERMLAHLSSQNDVERELSLVAARYMAASGEFPEELVGIVQQRAATDSSAPEKAAAYAVLQSAAGAADMAVSTSAQAALAALPPQAFIHYARGDEDRARALADRLKETGNASHRAVRRERPSGSSAGSATGTIALPPFDIPRENRQGRS
jgi:hypothetical protein